jgi:hypothetical protein
MSLLMEYDPLLKIQEYQPEAMELEGQEAFKRLLRNRGEMAQLFQSPQWKILVEYLLSERNNALNEIIYQKVSAENHFSYGLEMGKIRMIDAFIDFPNTIKAKLKEEQAVQ